MERMKDMSSTAMSAPHTLVIEDREVGCDTKVQKII